MSLPWIPGAVMDLLLADPQFKTLSGQRCGTRLPSDVTKSFTRVQVSGGISLSGDGVAWSPLVQVDGYQAPTVGGDDPERVAWALAVEAARVLGKARNVMYQSMSYSARLIDGPIPGVDVSRGTDAPLYRATVRAELRVHTT